MLIKAAFTRDAFQQSTDEWFAMAKVAVDVGALAFYAI
jgi:hypothetical protein